MSIEKRLAEIKVRLENATPGKSANPTGGHTVLIAHAPADLRALVEALEVAVGEFSSISEACPDNMEPYAETLLAREALAKIEESLK